MNKYFDNILFYLQKSGGGSVYWGELIKRFNNDSSATFIQPSLPCSNIVLNHLSLHSVLTEVNIPLKILRYIPITCKIEEGALFHSSYYRYCNQKNVNNIVTVHDFIYEHYNSGIPKFIHNRQKGMAIKKSKGIICISNSTKMDLMKFFPDLIKGKKIEVIYNGVSEDFNPILDKSFLYSKYPMFQKYKHILYVGHRTNYKNFDLAVNVVKELNDDYKLAIVGNTFTKEEIAYLNLKIPDKFVFFGNVTNAELNELYNIAECLLYPSSYEGFGIPVIEAFRCGCPVVAQDIPAIKEISKNGALLVKGLDILAFRDAILNLSKDSIKTDLNKIGMVNSKNYSWDKCFSEVNEFYKSI